MDESIRAERLAAQAYEATLAACVARGAAVPGTAAAAALAAITTPAAAAAAAPAPRRASGAQGDAAATAQQRLAQLRRVVSESRLENEEHEIWLASLVARV